MRSAVLCHAAEDKTFAASLARFVEMNCPIHVSLEEGEIPDGEDLIDRIEWAASADIALALLSPESTCKEWKRERWEPIFTDQAPGLAFLLLRECRFPKLLRTGHFFDVSRDALTGQRVLKRWLLATWGQVEDAAQLPELDGAYSSTPESLEELRKSIADRPAIRFDVPSNDALAFAAASRDDFEGVFWIDCAYRDKAGILGDAGHALNLKLAGSIEENTKNLLGACAKRRFLLVLENMLPEFRELFSFGGRASAIFTTPTKLKPPRPLAELEALFSSWTTDHAGCLSALGEAKHQLELLPFLTAENAAVAVRLGSAMCAFLKHHDRLAEAYEVLELLKEAAHTDGDTLRRYDFEWDQNWILERWGAPIIETARPNQEQAEPIQTGFDFDIS